MMKRAIRIGLMTAAAAAMLGGVAVSPAAADEPTAAPVVAESAAQPELFGKAVYDWCTYKAEADAPIYAGASTNADRKGTISRGNTFKSRCGMDGMNYDAGSYTVCGGGNDWRWFVADDLMGSYRYVPAACLENDGR